MKSNMIIGEYALRCRLHLTIRIGLKEIVTVNIQLENTCSSCLRFMLSGMKSRNVHAPYLVTCAEVWIQTIAVIFEELIEDIN